MPRVYTKYLLFCALGTHQYLVRVVLLYLALLTLYYIRVLLSYLCVCATKVELYLDNIYFVFFTCCLQPAGVARCVPVLGLAVACTFNVLLFIYRNTVGTDDHGQEGANHTKYAMFY